MRASSFFIEIYRHGDPWDSRLDIAQDGYLEASRPFEHAARKVERAR